MLMFYLFNDDELFLLFSKYLLKCRENSGTPANKIIKGITITFS